MSAYAPVASTRSTFAAFRSAMKALRRVSVLRIENTFAPGGIPAMCFHNFLAKAGCSGTTSARRLLVHVAGTISAASFRLTQEQVSAAISCKRNRALSAGNACLYGLSQAAILSAGYSPALGFIHTGKQLSFVYDIADLYKAEFIIPVAFKIAAANPANLEHEVRIECRRLFAQKRLIERIVPDIARLLDVPAETLEPTADPFADDAALPEDWWSPRGFSAETPIGEILAIKAN